MRGLHEAQAAVLVEGDAAPAQLHLEVEAVVRGPEEHRLPAKVEPLLAALEDAPEDELGLLGLVGAGDQLGPLAGPLP